MTASHSPLNDPEYLNWVTVGRAIQLSKKGIEKVIQNAIDSYHGTLLTLLTRHSSIWKSHLEKAHRSHDKKRICWLNSDSTKWFTAGESWEIAKVFMAPLGIRKGDVTNAGTSDLSGLLNILEWCPRGPGGVFRTGVNIPSIADARRARNLWAHAPNLHLSVPETADAFKFLESLLRDPELFSDKDVQLAVNDLTRLSSTKLAVLEESDRDILLQFKNEIGQDIASLESQVFEWREQAGADMDQIKEQVKTFNELVVKRDEIWELVEIIDDQVNRRVDDVEERLGSYVQSNNSRVEKLEAKVNSPKNPLGFASKPVISFNPVCERMQEDFVGREWLFNKVEDWLDKNLKPKESRTFIIWGGPGTGKTAWAREMIARERKPAAYHLCQNDNPITSHLLSLIENLSSMLAESIPEYADYIYQPSFTKHVESFKDNPEKQFDLVITSPLQQLEVTGTHYILIDGLDEGGTTIASCLAKLSRKLPSCFRLILTSRHGAPALSNLFTDSCDASLDEFKVNEVSVHNYLEEDIRSFITQKFEKMKNENHTIPPFFARGEKTALEEIVQASKQCFLFAKLVIEDIFDGKIEVSLPASLYELYYLEFRSLFPDTVFYERNVAPIIGIVLALRELDVTMLEDARRSCIGKLATFTEHFSMGRSWVSFGMIFGDLHKEFELVSRVVESPLVAELGKRTLGKILKSLSAYLISRNDIYYFSHSSIVEFLKDDSSDYFCDAYNGHRIMAKFYLNILKDERLHSTSGTQESVDTDDSLSEFDSEESDKNFVYLFAPLIFRYFYHSSHLPPSEGNCVTVLTDELNLQVITLLSHVVHWGGNRTLILSILLDKTDILIRLSPEAKVTIFEHAIRVGCKDITAKVIESGYWLFNYKDVQRRLLGFFLLNRKREHSGKSILQEVAPGEAGTDDTYIDFLVACTKKKGSFPHLLFSFMCDDSGLMQHYIEHLFVSVDNPDVAVPGFFRNTLLLDESTCWNKDVENYFGKLKSQKKSVINFESLNEGRDFLDLGDFTYRVIEQPLPEIEKMIKKRIVFVSFIYGWHVLLRGQGDKSLSCIEFLMKNGASVNAIGELGETGLMIAVKYGFVKMVEFLLKSGADVNQQDFMGSTVLHYAVDKREQEKSASGKNAYETSSVIFALVLHQPNPFLRNLRGYTAIDLARLSRNPFHCDLLTAEIF